MKIGMLSDLHVDLEHRDPQAVVAALATVTLENAADALIIAGDVANDYRTTLQALRTLEERTGARVLFVPGNHDIWNENHPRMTAWDIYDELRGFAGNLANGPQVLADGWVAVGDLGWYDYSFGGPEYTQAEFDHMQIGDRLWQDKVKAVWGRPALDMHAFFYARLNDQLARCAGKRVILVTHAVPIRPFTVQPPDATWNYLNAFLGSERYGELALSHSVPYAVCGHVHYRREQVIQGTHFICQCLNYASQWEGNADPLVEVRRAFKTIVI
jgi:putative phosphoesterase